MPKLTEWSKIPREVGFIDFCNLGSGRNLPKLHAHYEAMDGLAKGPALSTLKRWHVQDQWRPRAAEYDAQLDAASAALNIDEKARERIHAATATRQVGHESLEAMRRLIGQIKVPNKETAREIVEVLKPLAEVTIQLFRESDALEGMKPYGMPAAEDGAQLGVADAGSQPIDEKRALEKLGEIIPLNRG